MNERPLELFDHVLTAGRLLMMYVVFSITKMFLAEV
jgi:hypothetical protein